MRVLCDRWAAVGLDSRRSLRRDDDVDDVVSALAHLLRYEVHSLDERVEVDFLFGLVL